MNTLIKTVNGDIPCASLGITLPHEHIICCNEIAYKCLGNRYLDKTELANAVVKHLQTLKEKYSLATIVDCTPLDLGRDVELLKIISEYSGVNIVCSTGFYYTEEATLSFAPQEMIADILIQDACSVNAGVLKAAVEQAELTPYLEKILRATAQAQKELQIPIVLHTNAYNKNALAALDILIGEGVKPQSITVGHLSDSEEMEYLKKVAKYGCYIGLDRLYDIKTSEYIYSKIRAIVELCNAGYEKRILLSHDAQYFNCFETNPCINETPRLSYCFEQILPQMPDAFAAIIMVDNPANMLKCGE